MEKQKIRNRKYRNLEVQKNKMKNGKMEKQKIRNRKYRNLEVQKNKNKNGKNGNVEFQKQTISKSRNRNPPIDF